jgi:hypothetical protein
MSAQFYYSILADLVVAIHFLFVLFVIFGGLLVIKWRRIIGFHVAAALWGAFIEFSGWVCPLTPLENWFRKNAAEEYYRFDFIARYLLFMLYPEGLTHRVQIALGITVIVLNMLIYAWIFAPARKAENGKD